MAVFRWRDHDGGEHETDDYYVYKEAVTRLERPASTESEQDRINAAALAEYESKKAAAKSGALMQEDSKDNYPSWSTIDNCWEWWSKKHKRYTAKVYRDLERLRDAEEAGGDIEDPTQLPLLPPPLGGPDEYDNEMLAYMYGEGENADIPPKEGSLVKKDEHVRGKLKIGGEYKGKEWEREDAVGRYSGGSGGYSGEYSGGSSGGYRGTVQPTYTFCNVTHHGDDIEFTMNGIGFMGASGRQLDGDEADFCIDLAGDYDVPVDFVRGGGPEWLSLNDKTKKKMPCVRFMWKDYSVPPVGYEFWEGVWENLIKMGVKSVVVCCMGSHGRTGTALAALLVVKWHSAGAQKILDFVRETHCKKSVENVEQEKYVHRLVQVRNVVMAQRMEKPGVITYGKVAAAETTEISTETPVEPTERAVKVVGKSGEKAVENPPGGGGKRREKFKKKWRNRAGFMQ